MELPALETLEVGRDWVEVDDLRLKDVDELADGCLEICVPIS